MEAAPVTIKDLDAPASGYDTKTLRVMVEEAREMQKKRYRAVSYTHLTLPTSGWV